MLGFSGKKRNETRVISQESAIRNKAGLEMLLARLHSYGELRNQKKDSKDDTASSVIATSTTEVTLGSGQLADKYPISGKNFRAFNMLLIGLHKSIEDYGDEDELTQAQFNLCFHAANLLVNRSIKERDTDVQVAKIDPESNWKGSEDSLSSG